MMRKLFISGLMVCLVACSENSTGLEGNAIDSVISIEIREILSAGSRNLTLSCTTGKNYNCSNFPISTKTDLNGNNLQVTFTGIGAVAVCATSIGPARTEVELRDLPNGQYSLDLNNADLKNHGTLFISGTEVKLIFPEQRGIDIVQPVINRIPDKTYWGTIGYATEASSGKVTEFIEKLKTAGAVFSKQTPGPYCFYDIDPNGEIISDVTNSGYYYIKAFVFQYPGDEVQFSSTIKSLALPYYDDLYINANTYTGEVINNWTN